MASNDIKSTHDINPTGCDDVTADYYVQVVKVATDGTETDEGMSIPQARSILQIEPGVPRDIFSMTLPDNSLEAIVGTLFGSYTHWQLIESDVEPVFTDLNWNAWPMPATFYVGDDPDVPAASDWTTKTWHLYTKDTAVVYTILNSAGANGITLSPNPETVPLTSLILTPGADAATQVIATWTDGNLAVTGKYTLLYTEVRDDQDSIVAGSLGNIFNDGDTISGLVPDTLYSLRVISYYVGGDWAESETLTKTTASSSAGTFSIMDPRPATGVQATVLTASIVGNVITSSAAHGMAHGDRYTYDVNSGTSIATNPAHLLDRQTTFVNVVSATEFTIHPTYDDSIADSSEIPLTSPGTETHYFNPATRYEQREDADSGVLEIQVQRLGSIAGGISVDGATYDSDDYIGLLTATDATDFTSITNDTINISDGSAAVQTVNVTLLAPTATTNKVFSYQFMIGTESIGAFVDTTSYTLDRRGDSVLCYIEAGGAGIEGFQQINDGVDDLLVLDVESPYSVWDKRVDNSTAATLFWSQQASTDAGGTLYGIGDNAVYSESTIDVTAITPTINFPVNLTTLGAGNELFVHLYCRTASGSANDNVHVAFTGVTVANLLMFDSLTPVQIDPDNPPSHHWRWVKVNVGDTRRSITNADISVGAEVFNIVQQNQQFRVKKAVITTNENYDCALVGAANPFADSENVGPPVSDWSTGTDPIDDLGNTDTAIVPVLEALDPDTLNPLDNETAVDIQATSITATFTGAINLVNPVIRLYKTTNDVELSGVTSVGGASLNIAIFNPSTQLEEGTDYYCTLKADQITNSSGSVVGVDFGSDKTSWNWTTLTAATDFVFLQDFSSRALGPYTDAMIRADFNHTLYDWSVTTTDAETVDSGDPARGTVLRGKHFADTAFSSIKTRLMFDADNSIVNYPGEIFPNSTDGTWDLTGGAPNASAFATREAERTAGTQKAYDEVWFSYDIRLIPGADGTWQPPPLHKIPGVCTGSPAQATHAAVAFAEGIYGFGEFMQIYGPTAFPHLGGPWLGIAYYSASLAQKNLVMKPNSGTVDDYDHYKTSNSSESETYKMPTGKWVTIKQHLKLNTAMSGLPTMNTTESAYRDNEEWAADGTLADATLTISVKEEGWPNEIVMFTLTDIFRWTDYCKIDSGLIQSHFNTTANLPQQDQWVEFDNFKVSTTPFTPTPTACGAVFIDYPLTVNSDPYQSCDTTIETAANVSYSSDGVAMLSAVTQLCTQQSPTVATWNAIASAVRSDTPNGLHLQNTGGGPQQGTKLPSQYTVTAAGVDMILSMVVTIEDSEEFIIMAYNSATADQEFGYTITVDASEPKLPATFAVLGGGEQGYNVIYEGGDRYRINIYGRTINTSGDLSIDVHCDRNNASKSLTIDDVDLYLATDWQGHTATRPESSFSITGHNLQTNDISGVLTYKVGVVPDSEQRLWLCGSNASNGIAVYLSATGIRFSKINGGVPTSVSHTFADEILSGTVFKIGWRQSSTTGMALTINGAEVDTLSNNTAVIIGTSLLFDASNGEIKDFKVFNEA